MTPSKRNVSFVDADGNKAVIELKITHRNGYPEFTACGEYDGGAGQCGDRINPRTDEQKQLLKLWDVYHLNGTNAGTKKQTEVLSGCESTDYTERTEFLSMYTIDGKPLTAIELKEMQKGIANATEKINSINSKLADVEGFKKEWKEVKKGGWQRSSFPEVIEIMSDGNGVGDFRVNKDKNNPTFTIGASFFSDHSYRNHRIPAKYNRRLEAYIKGLENDRNEAQNELKNHALKSALYDLHPTTGELFKYGSGWIKEDLPADLWEQVSILCEAIEAEEEERTADSIKVVDIATIDEEEDAEIFQAIEEVQEDENCAALALYLGLTVEELDGITSERYGYGNCLYECQGVQYYCGTQEEIDEAVQDYIENTAWAFNPSFLAEQTGIPQEAFKAMCEQCESGNDGVLAIINKTCGLESFAESAVNADGWGHFLNSWDGTADEIEYNGTKYLICRS